MKYIVEFLYGMIGLGVFLGIYVLIYMIRQKIYEHKIDKILRVRDESQTERCARIASHGIKVYHYELDRLKEEAGSEG
jgi:hypothetical protein